MQDGRTARVVTGTVEVPGASLYRRVRGSGPVLLMIPGGPTDADAFDAIVPLLAERYTVLTYDPRGFSRSRVHVAPAVLTVSALAEDARLLLASVTTEPAYVFGTSNGALVGLDLAARHAARVRAVVAHEPPATELLPDREHHRALGRKVHDTYRQRGVGAAAAVFVAGAGVGGEESGETAGRPGADGGEAPSPGQALLDNLDVFFGQVWPGLVGHVPDVDALRSTPTRVVVAVGEESVGQVAHRAAVELAGRLGGHAEVVPGDHGGYAARPGPFAASLHRLLAAQR